MDDIEKGESEAHREMHARIFEEHYDVLMQPRFSMVYTLPMYFRALPGSRIQPQELFTFSALRLYDQASKQEDDPLLDKIEEALKHPDLERDQVYLAVLKNRMRERSAEPHRAAWSR